MAVTESVKNLSRTTLSAAISSTGATSITVTSAATFPASGSFRIRIDNEFLIVTSGAGTTTWTVTRGAEGSDAATHSNGAFVYGVLSAGSIDHFIQSHTHTGGTDGSALPASHIHQDPIYSVSISTNSTGSTLDTAGILTVLNPSGAAAPTIGNKTSGDTSTVTLPTGSNGDLMMLTTRAKANGQYTNTPSGWSVLYVPALTYGGLSFYYRIRRSGDTGFTLGGSIASGVSWGCVAISGVNVGIPFAGMTRLSSSNATLSFGTVDFGLPNSYRMAFISATHSNSTAQTWTAPTGWTEDHDTYGVTFSHRTLTTGLATTPGDSSQRLPYYETYLTADTSFGTSGTELCVLTVSSPGRYLLIGNIFTSTATAYSGWITMPYVASANIISANMSANYVQLTRVIDVGASGATFSLGATSSSGTLTALMGTFIQAVRIQ